MEHTSTRPAVLVTGATGYIGGRLVPVLETAGVRLRCLARRPASLAARVSSTTEVVAGDLFDPTSLDSALAGIDVAYYLVHSMGAHGDYLEKDRVAARNFGDAAQRAGVKRIVYLGGLATDDAALSNHLKSRLETGQILRESGVPVVEFRASVVIGSGSLSFELIRALVERLPVMICPRWVSTLAQPIGIDDVLAYLAAALDLPHGDSRTFEIGGADRASYGDLMRQYARQRGLQRLMISVPFLTPRLSSLWLGLVTPVYARVGRELIAGLKNNSVVTDPVALSVFSIRPAGLPDAIARAIRYEDRAFALTRWSDARSSGGEWNLPADARFGTRLVDARSRHVPLDSARAFAPIAEIGGARGWYYATWLWRLRGAIDLLWGGVGMRRGRRDPGALAVGDALDFWRVEAFEPGRRVRLAAEMKLPGRAWLEFEVVPAADGAVIHQTAVFEPVGLPGLLYWYALLPFHGLIFEGMLREIATRAVRPTVHSDAPPVGQ
ncbi:MAG TPA: SDR family oxidoreductase [Vicinamibacterales bacterium]|nr:SDR family oxidoreductase [Vicinamibacterales bacterium]